MTRKEAIEQLESLREHCDAMVDDKFASDDVWDRDVEALDLAITALRGPTKEMVERMRGKWEPKSRRERTTYVCSKCGEPYGAFIAGCAYFCPSCGAPMRRAAVDMMQEMWKGALKDRWV